MDQADFRALLQGSGDAAGRTTTTTTASKRSRDTAFRPRSMRNPFKRISQPALGDSSVSAGDKAERKQSKKEDEREAKERYEEDDALRALRQRRADKEITQAEYLQELAALETGDVRQSGRARGLDRKLLERVRAGEDVFSPSPLDGDETGLADERGRQEDELEAAAEAAKSKVLPNRAALLAGLKSKTNKEETSRKEDKFRSIAKRNKDGTTTETIVENGKKVKIIRDAEGRIVKKLIKKDVLKKVLEPKTSPEPEKSKIVRPAEPTEPFDPDMDIFEDAGQDYDPLSSILASRTTIPLISDKPIFADLDEPQDSTDSGEQTMTSDTIERQFAQTLAEAEERRRERLAAVAKSNHDYGFGLKLAQAEDYDGSV